MNPALLVLSIVLAGSPAAPPEEDGVVVGELGRRLDAWIARAEGLGFSGSVLVARGDELVLAKGYGLADRAGGVPFAADTIVPLGSISKHFTAAAVLRLEMDGALALEDPLERFFEDVPEDKRGITLHQLLTHTAGFPEASDTQARDRRGFVASALAVRLAFPPGKDVGYSNLGYGLAAAAVEVASGRPFEAYLREALFEPAGMTDTGATGLDPSRLAHGLIDGRDAGTLEEQLGGAPGWDLLGAGGLSSTPLDMLRWDRALEHGTVLSKEAVTRMTSPQVSLGGFALGYGCGLTRTATDTRRVGHNGSNDVFSADFGRFPDDGLFVFGAGSSAGAYVFPIQRAVERMCLGEGVPLPPRVVEVTPAELASFAGTYALAEGGEIRVEAADGALSVASGNARAAALLHPVRPGQEGRRDELAERLPRAFTAAFGGELAELHDLVDPYAPLERWSERMGRRLDGWTAELGPFRSARAVSGFHRFGEIALVAVLELERGRMLLEYSFGQEEVGSIRGLDDFPPRVLRPTGGLAFVDHDLASGATFELRFDLGDDGAATALVLADGEGEVFARRRP